VKAEVFLNEDLSTSWRDFAENNCKGYSPLYECFTRACADSVDVMDFVRSLPAHAHQPNLLLAAIHERVLLGLEPDLSLFYSGEKTGDAGHLFVKAVLGSRDYLEPILATRFTQTNEIGRVAVIAPALASLPVFDNVTLIDVGTSAGLTLRLDDCFIDYGSYGSLGPKESKVKVQAEVLAGRPPLRDVPISQRIGLDRNVLDPKNANDARWLLACVWPDTGRLDRTRAALELAETKPSKLIEGDALETLSGILSSVSGSVVVTTTWVVAYMDIEYRARLSAELMAASQHRDIYWISMEAPGIVDQLPDVAPPPVEGTSASVVGLTTFAKGEIAGARVLAHVHGHGSWIWWYDR
jgi:hypothetical protein